MQGRKIPTQNIEVGMQVTINPRTDRTRKILINGSISKILSSNKNHPHGVLVELSSGEIGRVKNYIGINKISDHPDTTENSNNDNSKKQNIKALALSDESHVLEFKSSLLWSVDYSKEYIENLPKKSEELTKYGSKASKFIIAKSIVAFLNSDGGTLIIGVKEFNDTRENELIGIEHEFDKLRINKNEDGYRLEINQLIDAYFPTDIKNHINRYIKIKFEEVNGSKLCVISVTKSEKEVFLKFKSNKDEEKLFYRNDARIKKIGGKEMIDYTKKHFSRQLL